MLSSRLMLLEEGCVYGVLALWRLFFFSAPSIPILQCLVRGHFAYRCVPCSYDKSVYQKKQKIVNNRWFKHTVGL